MAVRPKGKGGQLTDDEIKKIKRKFLIKYSRTGVMHNSAEDAGTTVRQIRRWLEKDEKFATKFDEMQEKFVDALEMVAVQRAIEKSDTLLIALLKANRREKYRENHKVESDVTERKTIQLVFAPGEVGAAMPNYVNHTEVGHGDTGESEEAES